MNDYVYTTRPKGPFRESDFHKYLGASVKIDGQDFMVAGFEPGVVVFENEDERIVRCSFARAWTLLNKPEAK